MKGGDSRIPPRISGISVVPSVMGDVGDYRAHIVNRDVHRLDHYILSRGISRRRGQDQKEK